MVYLLVTWHLDILKMIQKCLQFALSRPHVTRFLLFAGRQDPNPLDSTRGDSFPKIYVSLRRVELWHRHVGGHVFWRKALLGHEQPGCKFKQKAVSDGEVKRFIMHSILKSLIVGVFKGISEVFET